MENLIIKNQQAKDNGQPDIDRIAELHADFVKIHPFVDGNGRTGRLIMNLELMSVGYSIAIIEPTDREAYYNALAKADNGNYQSITRLVKETVQRSIERELQIVYPQWQKDYPKLAYQLAKQKEVSEKKHELTLVKEQEKLYKIWIIVYCNGISLNFTRIVFLLIPEPPRNVSHAGITGIFYILV